MNNATALPSIAKACGASQAPSSGLPCAHSVGKEVLVCVTGHTNVKGVVAAVTFTDAGHTLYDVYVDESAAEVLLLRGVASWRVAGMPDDYNGAGLTAQRPG